MPTINDKNFIIYDTQDIFYFIAVLMFILVSLVLLFVVSFRYIVIYNTNSVMKQSYIVMY